MLNTADNTYCSCGKFDRDAQNDMVVSSPWGLGVLSLQNSSHVFMAPNGTRLGDWLLNSGDNTVRLVADLDGDGLDEIFITSPWGVGVLKMTGGALQSVAMHANGSSIDGYTVRNTHTFALADNLKSGGAKQIVAIDNTGIHILGLSGHRLMRVAFGANGTRVNGWVIDTSNNRVQRAGDMNGDGRAEFLIRSPWGIGIMGLDTANHLHCYTLVPYNTPLND